MPSMSVERNGQRGSTLIEVMIALLVLAVGLLGFAGMQTKGVQMARKAYRNSQAAFLANDIVERMQANPTAIASYAMANTSTIPVAGTDCGVSTSNCSTAALASWDLQQWVTSVLSSMPNSVLSVAVVSIGGLNSVTVNITYSLNNEIDAASAVSTLNAVNALNYTYTQRIEL